MSTSRDPWKIHSIILVIPVEGKGLLELNVTNATPPPPLMIFND